ncbi:MAG: hypothetical protein U1E94_00070 [Agitococcus sp.]
MRLKSLVIASLLSSLCSITLAETLTVSGVGKALIGMDAALTRTDSLMSAKKDAVLQLINKINGPRAAADPAIQAKLDLVVKQIGDEFIVDQSTSRDAANNLVTTLKIQIDDLQVRSLISDLGIAQTTARNYPILILMDEFFTTPTDSTKPLKEVVEFASDKSASYSEKVHDAAATSYDAVSSQSSAERVSTAAAYQADAQVQARRNTEVNGYYGSANEQVVVAANSTAAAKARYDAAAKSESNSNESSSDSRSYGHEINAEQKDIQTFKKLVEYQPRNVGPDKQNYTLQALLRQTARYDLAVRDSDLFRSKYFTGKPLTLEEMTNSSELARFTAAARDEQADFFMMGNTIILDNGKNTATGQFVCDGLLSLKTFSTEDGSAIAAEARSESASGNTPDQCRVNVANKMGNYAVGVVGHAISEYWKKRETYGREYTVVLKSLMGNLNENAKDAFSEAVESIQGLNSKVVERRSNRSELEVALTYKGEKSISRAIGAALKNQAVFSQSGRKVDGTKVIICLEGQCP